MGELRVILLFSGKRKCGKDFITEKLLKRYVWAVWFIGFVEIGDHLFLTHLFLVSSGVIPILYFEIHLIFKFHFSFSPWVSGPFRIIPNYTKAEIL